MLELPESWRALVSLVVAAAMLTTMGSAYAISSWNAQLKELLSLDQSQITAVNSSISFGLYLAILPGIFYDRYGVRATVAVAAALLPLFFASAYAQAVATAPGKASAPLLVFTFFAVGLLTQFACMVCIAANEGNFGSARRGTVLGFLFSCFSGGGAVFAFVFKAFFDHHVADYFFFLAVTSLVVCGLGVLLLYTSDDWSYHHHDPSSKDIHDATHPLLLPSSNNPTGLALVRDRRFWALFFPTLVGVGSGLFINGNLAFIVQSRRGDVAVVPTLVSLFSVCNVGGRLAIGAISDAFVGVLSRGHFLSIGLAAMAFAQLSFLWGTPASLYLSVPLAGLAEGFLFPTYSILTRELFGAKHFGKNFGYMTLANAIGFPLVLGPLGNYLYHLAATVDPATGMETCVGPACFNPMFVVCAALNGAALLGSWHLH
ncbi:Aste57867_16344 [Aphanomyces stellatus]|uniref:Aste57867_16344 protein n=1 Tax=Aphanomyces stellatus TaxID=120398 RepID=A0A485L586_9STRA|nr:hypothetical protein As57867_016287 [Aphanomyces stellatus]VFT93120.1 Aste57867_16344 [Aphanomyces stellatus]